MARKVSLNEAKQKAGRFCAFRERSPNEVFEKGKAWGLSDKESEQLVSLLTKEGFIDEQRFANAYCHDKFEFNSWGKQKIRAGIYPHKISPGAIDQALERIDPEKYKQKLDHLAYKKWMSLAKEEEMKRKQRTVSYLANKGYELDLIWESITTIEKGH